MGSVTVADGQIRSTVDPSRAVSITEAMRRGGIGAIEEEASFGPSEREMQYPHYSHSAVFAEVRVDEEFGTIRVRWVFSAIAGGRILNRKTARSQVMGAIATGIGTALEEESAIDQTFGRFVTRNLADYHAPVNADVHDCPSGLSGLASSGVEFSDSVDRLCKRYRAVPPKTEAVSETASNFSGYLDMFDPMNRSSVPQSILRRIHHPPLAIELIQSLGCLLSK